jgi:hypothetical protein
MQVVRCLAITTDDAAHVLVALKTFQSEPPLRVPVPSPSVSAPRIAALILAGVHGTDGAASL